jgi:hypothetical protein
MTAGRHDGRQPQGPAEGEPERLSDELEHEPWATWRAPLGSPHGSASSCVPSTPGELLAMQQACGEPEQRQPPCDDAAVAGTMARQQALDLNAWESQQLALELIRQLEAYHKGVVAEMHASADNTPAQLACWAIDGDRLMQCRRLLESITLI